MLTKHGGNMKIFENSGLTLMQFEGIDKNWPMSHALSTRKGGVSTIPFDSLNVGIHVGDLVKNVIENRKKICRAIGASTEKFVAMQQAHTANVTVIKSERDFGGLVSWEEGHKNVDAIVTNLKNVTLFTMAADCAMTLFFDPVQQVLCLAHCGWRGALLNIYSNVIKVMSLEYGTQPQNLFAGISPTISCQSYQVGEDLIKKLNALYEPAIANGFYKVENDGYYLDIQAILLYQLGELGVKNVELANICTAENTNLFYSHRQESGKTGRFGIFAYLI